MSLSINTPRNSWWRCAAQFFKSSRFYTPISIKAALVKMTYDAWSMFSEPVVYYGSKYSKLCAHDEPRNLESKCY